MINSSHDLNDELVKLLYLVPLREVWDRVNLELGLPPPGFERERIAWFVAALDNEHFWAFKRGRRLRKIPVEALASLTWDDLSGFTHINDPLRGRDNHANSLFVVRDDKTSAYEDWSESYIYIERDTAKRVLEKLAKPQCEEPKPRRSTERILKKDRAADAYRRIFPSGHSTPEQIRTWGWAAKQVSKELSDSVDERTLKRGLGAAK